MAEEITIDYKEIADQLYRRHKAGDIVDGEAWYSIEEFIEAKHRESKQKGKVFYSLLITAMARTGESNPYFIGIFNRVYDICKQKIEGITPATPALAAIKEDLWQVLIKEILQTRLIEIESKISDKIALWKQRKNLIECAAFCQLLYDKKYFEKGSTNRKTVNEFALSKYGTDISTQLGSAKKTDREKHKSLLLRLFK